MEIDAFPPDTVLLADVHDAESNVFKFLELTAEHFGIERGPFWKRKVPEPYLPRLTPGALAGPMEKDFDAVVCRYDIWSGFHPFVAVYVAMQLVAAAHELRRLHPANGRALVERYVVAGARTAPSVEQRVLHAAFLWRSRLRCSVAW